LFHPDEEIIFEHFNMEGDSKKGDSGNDEE
jgi:hypothetical protein